MAMIQIRNVSEPVHRGVKARAALEGLSMSDYILRLVEQDLERPTRRELMERLLKRPRRNLPVEPTAVLREERDAQ